MAFSFGGSAFGSTGGGAGADQAQNGPDLPEIQTEGLGFRTFNGEAKVRLLPTAWPADKLPPPTSSLLSIASNKGLLAAGGTESVVVARTETIRKAFDTPASDGDYRPFTPDLTLPVGTRISQVSFSSDGSVLVLSAEAGGGLAIYETASLLQGNTKSAFELPTNGSSVRALVPNPEIPETFAVVTEQGQLLIASMKDRQFVNGQNGQILKEGVSSVSWSNKGKQLVAGMGNGTACQMKPDGTSVAEIPKPPGLTGDHHISAISWLENDLFLTAYTPIAPGDGMAPATDYYIITRKANTPFTYQKLPEVCGPFGLNRSPAFQFIQRLRNFEPSLKDMIIISSTASQDIEILIRTDTPLTRDVPADQIKNVFTATRMANDSRRAQVPMTEDMTSDTSSVGMALDLSSTEMVLTPIPGDEIESTKGPLPAIFVLTNEGVLCGWWVVYNDSVRQGLTYSGMTAVPAQSAKPAIQASPSPFGVAASSSPAPAQPAFGQSAFGSTAAATPAFGSASKPSTPSFGSATTPGGSAFGNAGALGSKASPWGGSTATPQSGGAAFGKPAFGQAPTPAFGSAGGLGSRSSPWGQTSNASPAANTASAFGQASTLGAKSASPFGSAAATPTSGFAAAGGKSGGGFASFASKGGFTSAAAIPNNETKSVFGQPSNTASGTFGTPTTATSGTFGKPTTTATSSSFGTPETSNTGSLFGKPANASPFATASANEQKKEEGGGLFGMSKGGFTLNNSKSPAPEKDDKPVQENPFANRESKPAQANPFATGENKSQSSFFGSGFGDALGEAAKEKPAPVTKEADMAEDNGEGNEPSSPETRQQTTTPNDTPAASKFFPAPPATGGLFGTQTQNSTTPAQVQKSLPTSLFGSAPTSQSVETTKVPIKEEPEEETSAIAKDIPQAPLPPDATSKATYTPGNSSSSSMTGSKTSAGDDSPMPPDFPRSSSKLKSQADVDDVPLPSELQNTKAKPTDTSEIPPSDSMPTPKPHPTTEPKQTAESEPLPEDDADDGEDEQDEEDEEDEKDEEDEEDENQDEDDEEEIDDEGSGVDVEQELTPEYQSPKITPESSFGQKSGGPLLGGSFAKIEQTKQATKSLFGELGTPPQAFFPPPTRTQQSPRSPSPVRRAVGGDLLRPDNARSVSAPGVPLRSDTRKVTMGRAIPDSAVYPPQVSADRQEREERELLAQKRAKAKEAEEEELSDDNDDEWQAQLNSELQATKVLDNFLAHHDYAGTIKKPGIPGQIERVYRDINSMVGILGHNSWSLRAWDKGQEELVEDSGRSRQDLENSEDWCLGEIRDLQTIQSTLERELEAGRITDVPEKIQSLNALEKELRGQMLLKQQSIKQLLKTLSSPERNQENQEVKLSAEQLQIQRDLRSSLRALQSLLSTVEQELMSLRAVLATKPRPGSANNQQRVPTVEAVEKTIQKMTGMAEKKSSDIDYIESQLRRLNVSASPASSREVTPFMTPPTSAKKNRSLMKTPGSSVNGNAFQTPQSARSRFMDSVGSNSSEFRLSIRKKVSEVSHDDQSAYAEKAARRKKMHAALKEALIGGEVRIRTLDEI